MKGILPLFLFILPFISSAQQSDTVAKSNFASLYIYYPAEGMKGKYNIYMNDSVICKTNYNSKYEVKLYKEGKTVLWVKPQNKNSVVVDVKFGEEYFLKCSVYLDADILRPAINLVESVHGRYEFNETRENRDFFKAARASRKVQDTILRRNTIYLDLGGTAIGYSLSYDRLFRINKKVRHSVSLGVEMLDIIYTSPRGYSGGWNYYLIFPFSYNFIWGKKSDHLELGIGPSILVDREYEYWGPAKDDGRLWLSFRLFLSPKIGWRYQQKQGGFFFRTVFSPIINFYYYDAPTVFVSTKQILEPAYSGFFDSFWIGRETIGPILPLVGISVGYTFNFKKKK